jgi:PAS domain S-box-containing protein
MDKPSNASPGGNEEAYRLLFENNPNPLWVCDEHTLEFLAVNQAAVENYGYTREEFLKMTIKDIVAPAGKGGRTEGEEYRLDQLALRGGVWAHRKKDGTLMDVEVSSSPVPFDGVPARLVLVYDVTERKQDEEALQQERNVLRTLIDILPDYIYIKDLKSRFVVANAAVARVMGATDPKQLLGKTDGEFYPGRLATEFRADEEQLLRTGEPVINKDEPHADATGAMRDILTTKVPLRDAQGKITGLVGIGRDITELKQATGALRKAHDELELRVQERTASLQQEIAERKRTEQALAEQQHLLQSLMDYMPDNIYFKDTQSRFVRVNRAMAHWVGLDDPKAAEGKWDFDFFGEEHARQAFEDEQEIIRTGTPIVNKEEYETWPDGRVTWVSTSKLPLRDPAGRIIGTFGLSRDITAHKLAEEALNRTAEELARSNAELEQFAYIACHDLQEPLRMVTSYLGLLEEDCKGRLGVAADEWIAFAVDGAKTMQTLIQDLLAYSRVGTRGKPFAPADCNGVLGKALENLKVAIQENGAMVTHDPLPTVMADDTQLMQLFQNLIGNGIKFHSDQPPRVHVSAAREDGGWRFAVRDNGIGLDTKYADRIFLIFQRLHTRDEYPGTGIGLAVCKKIVERHGGRIWVESAVGKGATFCFTLPAKGNEP